MNIFSPDGPIYRMMRNFTDLLKINFLWLLCSLPIVTLGGATIAAYDVTLKMAADEEGHVGRQFLASFRKNWKTGIPYGLALLAGLYFVWLNFSLFEQLEDNPFVLLVSGMVGGFALLLMFLFAFPLQARYENTFFRTLKNSADISARFFLRTLVLLIVLALEIVVALWNSTTQFVALCIGPACVFYTVSGFARVFFAELEQEPGAVREDRPADL